MSADKQKIQEMYIEYQRLMQQIQQLQQNLQEMEKHISDLARLKNNLNSISKIEEGQETLMPLGSGIFIHGEIKNTQQVIMNVGTNICINKTIIEALETVDNQMNEVSNVAIQMEQEIEKTSSRIEQIQEEFQKINPEEIE